MHQFQNTKIVMAFRFKLVKAVSNRFCQVKTGFNFVNLSQSVNIFYRLLDEGLYKHHRKKRNLMLIEQENI